MQFDAGLLLLAMAPVFLACNGGKTRPLRQTQYSAQLFNWRDLLFMALRDEALATTR